MKKIGIYASSMGDNAFGVGKSYLDFISNFGSPKILTPDELYRDDIDLLLLPGGMDINPTSYGAIPSYFTGNTDVFKQHVYDSCLAKYINNGKKVFGICLGFQQLAAYFGSTLTQHMGGHQSEKSEAHDVVVEFSDHTDIFYSKGKNKFKVNSRHHQGLLRTDLGESLKSLLYIENEANPKDIDYDVIEGFIHNDLGIAGVQSHPEEFYSHYIYSLFDYILNK